MTPSIVHQKSERNRLFTITRRQTVASVRLVLIRGLNLVRCWILDHGQDSLILLVAYAGYYSALLPMLMLQRIFQWAKVTPRIVQS